MKFAFVVHPLSTETKMLLRLDPGKMLSNWKGDVLQFLSGLHAQLWDGANGPRELAAIAESVRVADEMLALRSLRGSDAEGRIYEIAMDADEILADPARAIQLIEEAIRAAAQWGAKIVGLGSLTGVVGGQGTYCAERASIAVTTGNSMTIYAAVKNLHAACREVDCDLSRETLAIIGVPGSIATAAARILAKQCGRLLLVARRKTTKAEQLARELGAELSCDIDDALRQARVIFSATSSGNCIDQRALQPGSLVIDVGVPTDVSGSKAERSDVLILSGGLTVVPPSMPLDSALLGFHRGVIPSCLGETMVLALENRAENFSLGRELEIERIQEIGAIAESHGFDFTRLSSFGLPLEASRLIAFRKIARRRRPAVVQTSLHGNGQRRAPRAPARVGQLAARAAKLHERHINPVMAAIGGKNGFLKTFVRGEGNYLWDADGHDYLDLVAGFGSVNLGHNHPRVVRAVQTALADQAPGFAQAAVNPLATALAERLVTLAPPHLEMVFFCNSGAESIEAALKLARIATGRPGFLSCDRSYHGKSLGALSVTANATYQRPFGPLLPGCQAVPYGDLRALGQALRTRQFAAFVVEPIQAEGGMHVPPPGYLTDAAKLCRETGTLLIADEVQTGLGRTGEMFCVEHDALEPDIITLAKSLGGGLMPIGAMLCRRDHWQKAYGTISSFALHTSTFGGGSLACAAGLATLDVLEDENLLENARFVGRELKAGLKELCQRYDLLAEVRGRGLLLGLEFRPLPESIARHWQLAVADGMAAVMMPNVEEFFRSIPAIYAMQMLLNQFKMYSQVARSNPYVLRIQPPLTITSEEAQRIVTALDQICSALQTSNLLFESMLAKSVLGKHSEQESGLPSSAANGVPAEMPAATDVFALNGH